MVLSSSVHHSFITFHKDTQEALALESGHNNGIGVFKAKDKILKGLMQCVFLL